MQLGPRLIGFLRSAPLRLKYCPNVFCSRVHRQTSREHSQTMSGPSLAQTTNRPVWKFKRAFDILFATCRYACDCPSSRPSSRSLVLIDVGHPVVFWQQRVGRLGRPLHVYKFRTMRAPFDRKGRPVPESERLSSIGRLLRATRLDEIPQLWNILTGGMSVVGPRPSVADRSTKDVQHTTPGQPRAHRSGPDKWRQADLRRGERCSRRALRAACLAFPRLGHSCSHRLGDVSRRQKKRRGHCGGPC